MRRGGDIAPPPSLNSKLPPLHPTGFFSARRDEDLERSKVFRVAAAQSGIGLCAPIHPNDSIALSEHSGAIPRGRLAVFLIVAHAHSAARPSGSGQPAEPNRRGPLSGRKFRLRNERLRRQSPPDNPSVPKERRHGDPNVRQYGGGDRNGTGGVQGFHLTTKGPSASGSK